MSSIRNAVQRRVHKERAQPHERGRFGILEKHKDYSARARDHNKKKAQLKSLRQKAADRNEDEFNYGMLSRAPVSTSALGSKGRRWTGTVDGDRGNSVMDLDTVRLLKTQDMGYVRTVRNVAAKEVRELEERVLGLGGRLDGVGEEDEEDEEDEDMSDFDDDATSAKKNSKKPNKIVFADAVDEREERIRQLEQAGSEAAQKEEEKDVKDGGNPEALRAEQRQRLLAKLQRRLQNSRKKLRILARTENELEMQRAKMAKTATVGGVTKSGKKIKVRERKR